MSTNLERIASFKDRFNEAILEKNKRPVDIARETHISEATISQYRSGYAEPKRDKLALLAKALSVSPVWLMGFNVNGGIAGAFDSTDPKLVSELMLNEQAKRLLGIYLDLSSECQKSLMDLAEFLYNKEKDVN